MSDLWLCWFQIATGHVQVTRPELRRLCEDLGIGAPATAVRDSKKNAFRSACRTAVQYTDSQGLPHTVTGRLMKDADEHVTYAVERQDGLKLAEWKFFQSRRNRTGLVRGTHLTKSMVRHGLPETEQAVARQWLAEAQRLFDANQQDTPHWSVRHQVNATLLSVATPVFDRRNFYFGYPEDYETAARIRVFLDRAMPGQCTYTLARLEPGGDRSSFAMSADMHLCHQLEELEHRLTRATQPQARQRAAPKLRQYQSLLSTVSLQAHTHINRLGFGLPNVTAKIATLQEMLAVASPHLPSQR